MAAGLSPCALFKLRRTVAHLEADVRRWARVKGLIGAVVACLVDLERRGPLSPGAWRAPSGETLS
eukprot:6418535-Pyramimonas_sp.AAC.1